MATPHSAREGRGLVTFAAAACCTGISFTCIAKEVTRPLPSLAERRVGIFSGRGLVVHKQTQPVLCISVALFLPKELCF